MTESDIHVVVLAAGKGTRMKSAIPKVLHRIAGRPLLDHVLAAAAPLRPASTTVVIGHQGDMIRAAYANRPDVGFVVQEPQLGTGHALLMAEPRLKGAAGTVLLLYGDVPLLSGATLEALVGAHRAEQASATVLTATVDRPFGYGRIVRLAGAIARIVEERDTSPAEREIREINAGIYAFELGPLFDSIRSIASANAQGEYYLPDLVSIYRARGLGVTTVPVKNADEIRGINSRTELAEVERIVRQTKNEELMAAGVTIIDPATTYVHPGRHRRRGHGAPSECPPRGPHGDWRGLRDPQRHAHRRLDARRSRHGAQLLHHHRVICRGRRGARAVRPP